VRLVVEGQQLRVLLQGVLVEAEGLCGDFADLLPNSDLELLVVEGESRALEDVTHVWVLVIAIVLHSLPSLLGLDHCLVLGEEKVVEVGVEEAVSDPAHALLHDLLLEVCDDSELLPGFFLVDKLELDLEAWVCLVDLEDQRHFVSVIGLVDKAIVEEETGVALATVAIVDLRAASDVVAGLDDEAFASLVVIPGCLAGSLVVQHVGVGHEAVSFDTVDCDTEDSGGDHHPDFRVLTKGELSEVGNLLADQVIIDFDVFNFLMDLIQEWASLQIFLFIFGEEDWEVVETLW